LREHVEAGTVQLVTGFSIQAITPTPDGVEVSDGARTIVADRVVSATGFRPDHSIVSELRLDLDPILGSTRALAPLIDPNQHSCGTVAPHGVDELAHPELATTPSAQRATAGPRPSCSPPATSRPAPWSPRSMAIGRPRGMCN
jgi:hypothetical protein